MTDPRDPIIAEFALTTTDDPGALLVASDRALESGLESFGLLLQRVGLEYFRGEWDKEENDPIGYGDHAWADGRYGGEGRGCGGFLAKQSGYGFRDKSEWDSRDNGSGEGGDLHEFHELVREWKDK